uniref:Uncharacterized protein n=1 Tax=Oryza glumipatula TaxID=40148 RepID=A0A0E0BD93_9ORYZ
MLFVCRLFACVSRLRCRRWWCNLVLIHNHISKLGNRGDSIGFWEPRFSGCCRRPLARRGPVAEEARKVKCRRLLAAVVGPSPAHRLCAPAVAADARGRRCGDAPPSLARRRCAPGTPPSADEERGEERTSGVMQRSSVMRVNRDGWQGKRRGCGRGLGPSCPRPSSAPVREHGKKGNFVSFKHKEATSSLLFVKIKEEARTWTMAGAKHLRDLLLLHELCFSLKQGE